MADWDADDDLDLVVGTVSGKVVLLANEGSAKKPKFGKPVLLLQPGPGCHKTGPCVADWDRDGDLDLIVGTESKGILLFRNEGTRDEPKLAPPVELTFGGKPWRIGYRPKPFVTDVNGDGRPDLLVGTCESGKGEDGKRKTRGFVYVCLRPAATPR